MLTQVALITCICKSRIFRTHINAGVQSVDVLLKMMYALIPLFKDFSASHRHNVIELSGHQLTLASYLWRTGN